MDEGFWIRDVRVVASSVDDAVANIFRKYPEAQQLKIWRLHHVSCNNMPTWQAIFRLLEVKKTT